MPEAFWDADKKFVKLEELAGKFGELSQAQQAEADRRAALPKTAAEYAFTPPQGFEFPVNEKGQKGEIDPKAPMWAKLQEMAHEKAWSQEDFSKLGAMHLQAQIDLDTARANIEAQRVAAENEKLGENRPARVEAVHRFMDASFGDGAANVKNGVRTADDVIAWEKMITALQSSGITALNGTGRDTGPKPGEIPGYETMSWNQKFAAAKAAGKAA